MYKYVIVWSSNQFVTITGNFNVTYNSQGTIEKLFDGSIEIKGCDVVFASETTELYKMFSHQLNKYILNFRRK